MSTPTIPSVPPQRFAVMDGDQFSMLWYLYLQALPQAFAARDQIAAAPAASTAADYRNVVILSAAGTIGSPAPPLDGSMWCLRVEQDATGGWAVTWGPNVMLAPEITAAINSAPLTMCLLSFIGWGGKWYCQPPVLQVPIV